jgi:spore maturation protein CgeB
MRTFEVPACGAFMMTERTEEHREIFEEDRDTVFFGSIDEAIEKIRYYLEHNAERICIAQNGYNKIVNGTNTYTNRVREILNMIN